MSESDAKIEDWIRTFRGPLVGYLVSLGARWSQAEDLAADTFAEGWLSWSRFRGRRTDLTAVGPWLCGIAARLHWADGRRQRRLRTVPIVDELPAAGEPASDPRHEALEAAIAALPAQLQQVVRMRYLEDTPSKVVAALLGVTPKAVERRLHEARRRLMDRLDRARRAAEMS
jgi:RNA polymerase sigma factor (sigma-70 family)